MGLHFGCHVTERGVTQWPTNKKFAKSWGSMLPKRSAQLDDLGSKFSAFGSQLATTVNRLEYFNTNAGKTVAALKQMADSAGATAGGFPGNGQHPAASVPAGGGANAAGMLAHRWPWRTLRQLPQLPRRRPRPLPSLAIGHKLP